MEERVEGGQEAGEKCHSISGLNNSQPLASTDLAGQNGLLPGVWQKERVIPNDRSQQGLSLESGPRYSSLEVPPTRQQRLKTSPLPKEPAAEI